MGIVPNSAPILCNDSGRQLLSKQHKESGTQAMLNKAFYLHFQQMKPTYYFLYHFIHGPFFFFPFSPVILEKN